jgi:hypothetical protein
MIETRNVKRREVMSTESGTRHANKGQEEQKIRSGPSLRHGMTTIRFHVNGVRLSPWGNTFAPRLASRLSLGLGLRGRNLALLQDSLHDVWLQVQAGAVLVLAVARQELVAPLVDGALLLGLAVTLAFPGG